MTERISHHIPDALMASYVAGTLPKPFALVVATHVSMCDSCRANYLAHQAAGGAVLENIAEEPLSGDLRDRVLGALDDAIDLDDPETDETPRDGIYPGPVMAALKGKAPRWKSIGGGVRQWRARSVRQCAGRRRPAGDRAGEILAAL